MTPADTDALQRLVTAGPLLQAGDQRAALLELARRDYLQAVEVAYALWSGADLYDATAALWDARCGAEQVTLPPLPQGI
jgi:hypothetical protein